MTSFLASFKKQSGYRFIINPMAELLYLAMCAILASAVSGFILSPDLGLGGAFIVGVVGPIYACLFLLFVMLPWFIFLKAKNLNQFFLWPIVPVLLSPLYLLYGPIELFRGDRSLIIIFAFTAFLTSTFMWLLSQHPLNKIKTEVSE